MKPGHGMVRSFPDFESYRTAMHGTNDSVDISRIKAVKEQKVPAIAVTKTTVQLNGQAVGFFSKEIIIVDSDPLTGHQLVRY